MSIPEDGFDFRSLSDSFENTAEVGDWINTILDDAVATGTEDPSSLADLTTLDRRVSNVLASLEIVSEDTSTQLERIIDDISRGAPRLAYDLHFMKEGAVSLQNSLQKLQQSSSSIDSPETKAALERLHYLDMVKRRMEAARDVLREAESWSTLESEVLSLLSEQNYEKAAETLSEAAKSMVVFQNTPEYETRRSLMVSLQNQLEASLSSALVAAINSQDVAVCRSYFSIFSNIQRESEFRNYYYGSRRALLVTTWQKTHLRDVDSESAETTQSNQTFSAFLPSFYASFTSLLEAERLSIPSIFPDPQATLSVLISSTLSSLQPTVSQRIPAVVHHYGPSAITEIISCYTSSVEFALSTENVMEKIGYSAPPLVTQGSDEGEGLKHARRRSRLSISRRMGSRNSISIHGAGTAKSLLSLSNQEWQHELFEPFLDYQVDYGTLEQKFLGDRLDRSGTNEGTGGKAKDGARWLKERTVDVFSLAEQSLTRCMTFTHGYGVVGLIQALDSTFKSVVDASRDDISNSTNRATTLDRGGGDDLSDMDYTAQDWSRIQNFLHLLEATKAFHDRLTGFENKLRSHLVQVSENMRAAQSDMFSGGRSSSGTARGALQILAQSTLNSVQLQELLRSVEPDALLTAPSITPRTPQYNASFSSPAPQSPLMTGTRAAISGFARTCQVSLQRTILSPLHKHLGSYSTSAVWVALGDPTSRVPGSRGTVNEVHVPIFSISPSDTVQRVAEGLLNLPRLFEVYADDDALSFSIETLPFVDEDLLRAVTMESSASSPVMGAPPTPGHIRRSPSISIRPTPPAVDHPPAPPVLGPEAVSSAWLSSLALSLLSFMTSSVLPSIKSLSTAGAAQLSADLAYLGNVVQALNVQSLELEKWKELVDMSDDEGKKQTKERREGTVPSDPVFNIVARIRGWNS